MENDTDKLIRDRWESLPLDVKQALTNIPWRSRVQDIAKREMLVEEKADQLETELLLVLYGFVPPEDLAQNLITEMGIEDEQAERLTKMIETGIITDIEKQLEMIDALMPESSSNSVPVPTTHEPAKEVAPVVAPLEAPVIQSLPEVAPNILPETLPNEVAHDTVPTSQPSEEATINAVTPQAPIAEATNAPVEPEKKSGYPGGVDPYREPIE